MVNTHISFVISFFLTNNRLPLAIPCTWPPWRDQLLRVYQFLILSFLFFQLSDFRGIAFSQGKSGRCGAYRWWCLWKLVCGLASRSQTNWAWYFCSIRMRSSLSSEGRYSLMYNIPFPRQIGSVRSTGFIFSFGPSMIVWTNRFLCDFGIRVDFSVWLAWLCLLPKYRGDYPIYWMLQALVEGRRNFFELMVCGTPYDAIKRRRLVHYHKLIIMVNHRETIKLMVATTGVAVLANWQIASFGEARIFFLVSHSSEDIQEQDIYWTLCIHNNFCDSGIGPDVIFNNKRILVQLHYSL